MRHSCTMLVVCYLIMAGSAAANCFQDAGERYHIDPLRLYAIAEVESGMNPAALNTNRDGSRDIGLMQINSRHLPRLAAFGIDEHKLRSEPCTSVMVRAWILAQSIQQLGYGWQAVGAYNAGALPEQGDGREHYALQVWHYYRELLALYRPTRR